jgi:adenylate cyclase
MKTPASDQVSVEAEAWVQKALDMARQQRARSLELRAAISLARLRQKQGRSDEGRQVLLDVYMSFAEGFDTGDLRTAASLLAS